MPCPSPLLAAPPQVQVVASVSLVAVAVLAWFLLQSRPVYLVDFAVFRAPDSWIATTTRFLSMSKDCQVIN